MMRCFGVAASRHSWTDLSSCVCLLPLTQEKMPAPPQQVLNALAGSTQLHFPKLVDKGGLTLSEKDGNGKGAESQPKLQQQLPWFAHTQTRDGFHKCKSDFLPRILKMQLVKLGEASAERVAGTNQNDSA